MFRASLLCLAVLALTTPVVAVELTGSASPNVAIANSCWGCTNATSSTINIPAGITSIADIRCSINISGVGAGAAYFLIPELISPSGHTVALSNFNCGGLSSVANINVTFGQGPNAYNSANINNGWNFVMDCCLAGGMSMNTYDTLNPTGTWTLRVGRDHGGPNATLVEWELTVSDTQIGTTPPPANDDCLLAIPITDMSTTVFDMTSATPSFADCAGNTQEDIWYSLTADCAGNHTFSTANSTFNARVSIYDGAFGCPLMGSPTIGCGPGSATVNLVIGQLVFIQVSAGPSASPGAGEIEVTSDVAPANDDCTNPENGGNMSTTIAFDTSCATESGIPQDCGGGGPWSPVDVWYIFTADCDGALTLDTYGSSFDTMIAIWTNNMCPVGPPDYCNDNAASPPPGESSRSEISILPVSIGDTFLVQVGGGVLGEKGPGQLNVQWNCLPTAPDFLRGDANNDGLFNIADAVVILNTLFVPGTATPTCWDGLDANDDGMVNIADAVFALNALFSMGMQPPAPGPMNCGQDPTMDTLDECTMSFCP